MAKMFGDAELYVTKLLINIQENVEFLLVFANL